MAKKSIPSGGKLTAYAAFRLGFFTRRFDVAVLNEVLPILSTEIYPNSFLGLQQGLISVSQSPQQLLRYREPCAVDPRFANEASLVPTNFAFLLSMADRALPEGHRDRRVYEFGAALGDHFCELTSRGGNSGASRVLDCLRSLPPRRKQEGCLNLLVQEAKREPCPERAIEKAVQLLYSQRPSEVISPRPPSITEMLVHFAIEISRDLATNGDVVQSGWDEATEMRNKWIYDECVKITSYKRIIAGLKKHPDWDQISSVAGIKRAANEYAKRKGLPAPPPRQPGRPSSKTER